jgi:L-lysine exporter family protein LysE/ArgO
MNILVFIQGLILGFTLIIAIGPQNLFVIRQGLKKNYVFVVCLICSLSDSLLIIIGIILSSYLSEVSSYLVQILKFLGSGWLIIYGINKIKNSFNIKNYQQIKKIENFKSIILTTLAFTFLNPHVYLDTIVLIGTISLNFDDKFSFGFGVVISSFIFFYSLGYFCIYLSKFINDKKKWSLIDRGFGCLMIFYGIYFIVSV